MSYSTLNFNNLVSLRIPANEEELFLLKIQTGLKGTDWNFSVLEQRIYNRISLLQQILKDLPTGAVLVDIGAGNSLVDIALALLFPEKNFKFVLVDSDEFDPTQAWGNDQYNENGYRTYNDWSFVKKTIKLNDLPLANFEFVHPDDFKECNADVVMSFASCGWHYPIDTYLEPISTGLRKTGYLVLLPLLNVDNAVDKLNEKFGNAIMLEQFDFKESDYSPKEASKILKQIESGKLHSSPFYFHAIWQKAV